MIGASDSVAAGGRTAAVPAGAMGLPPSPSGLADIRPPLNASGSEELRAWGCSGISAGVTYRGGGEGQRRTS